MSQQDPFFERENRKQIDTLLRWAAEGDIYAAFSLGDYFYEGIFVERDIREAVKWYKISADAGNIYAQGKLVQLYENGEISDPYIFPSTPRKNSAARNNSKRNSSTIKPRKKIYNKNLNENSVCDDDTDFDDFDDDDDD